MLKYQHCDFECPELSALSGKLGSGARSPHDRQTDCHTRLPRPRLEPSLQRILALEAYVSFSPRKSILVLNSKPQGGYPFPLSGSHLPCVQEVSVFVNVFSSC